MVLAVVRKVRRSRLEDLDCESNGKILKQPPGPRPLPIIGNLHLLGSHEVPFEAFLDIGKTYGDIYSLTLGTTPCVIVNSFPLIKEVLIQKGASFGGRPNFIRYHQLFGGDRDNSLALCDWSEVQKARRQLARQYCHPRPTSIQFESLSTVVQTECTSLVEELSKHTNQPVDIKPWILCMCANVFSYYMCSERFGYNDVTFNKVVRLFDQIFWDINQGYAVDFLPWLEPFYRKHLSDLASWAKFIRDFILEKIINEHRETLDRENMRDFTDELLAYLEDQKNDPNCKDSLNWEHILYELEDFLGGHSAVGNLLMRAYGELCLTPDVAEKMYEEMQRVTGGQQVTLEAREKMPYTDAVLLETLRMSSSPIVPHVATEDTTVGGFRVKEGTMIFLNNYELNTSDKVWTDPKVFNPSRFLKNGKISKPESFIPFSTGKRACMGYRLVYNVGFMGLATMVQNFKFTAADNVCLPKACVAVPPDTFRMVLTPRS
ncbi:hypothetical protein QYM36_012848 [Artemia franciscana]|nr:hypothetical protein QYM36_012848 [Artemia franciscana]